MKTTSYGVLLVNEELEVLLAHPTHNRFWNLPKGGADNGESPMAAALREAEEEIGVRFSPADLTDLGQFTYLPSKDLYLYLVRVSKDELNIDDCVCNSTFELYGRTFPEMDNFVWATAEMVKGMCTKNLANIILPILSKIEQGE